jgi:uncharacterized protein YgiM (DUF1202 family)
MKKRIISALCLCGATILTCLCTDSGSVLTLAKVSAETQTMAVIGAFFGGGIGGDTDVAENGQPEVNVDARADETENAEIDATENVTENEYADFAIANVTDYVNVRSQPNTDGEILGKIYDGAVAQILETAGENDEWFHVTSGSVEGYIKAEYFIYGEEALAVIDDYVTRWAVVQADRLNVRKEPDISSKRIGYLDNGEKALVLEDCGEWVKVQYGGNEEGYVSSDYIMILEEFTYAKSIEEERAELEAAKALKERQETSEDSAPEDVTVTPPTNNYSDNEELRTEIVNYAMQFLGNKYVSGGNSLITGTDCSGFTSLIYADFGYSISRTPAGQYSSAGRAVDYSEAQPGDIICYGTSKCTHVGIYIGNGQIIHSANSRKGVVIYQADYDTIMGVRNVID